MLSPIYKRFNQTIDATLNRKRNILRILHICLLLIVASSAYAQNLDKKITIEAYNQSLGDVINQISEKGNILFSYNPQSIPVDKKITVIARNISL